MAASLVGLVNTHPVIARAATQIFTLGTTKNPADVLDGIGAGSDSYTTYSGDGSISASWPVTAQWVSFEDM